jgi:uncharacterized protein
VNTLILLAALLVQQPGPPIPAPRGFVNDFAQVITAESAPRIARLAAYVRERSGGEIAVVTLRDLEGREAVDVALRIGREWGVGAEAAVGDAARNAGVVLLVVPKETSADGRGHIAISTGRGVEGFIPDAVTGDIRREALPLLQAQDYSGAIELMTYRLAERYAGEFGFSMDSVGVAPPRARAAPPLPPGALIALFVLFFFVVPALAGKGGRGRGGIRGGMMPPIIIGGSGFGGGGGFGGFGGGGGGFGGFGGGGGFSGGGSSGSW